jgi:hypothetical protein
MSSGYYSDGRAYSENGSFNCSYTPFRTGDVIGCGVYDGKFFITRNGAFVGMSNV